MTDVSYNEDDNHVSITLTGDDFDRLYEEGFLALLDPVTGNKPILIKSGRHYEPNPDRDMGSELAASITMLGGGFSALEHGETRVWGDEFSGPHINDDITIEVGLDEYEQR